MEKHFTRSIELIPTDNEKYKAGEALDFVHTLWKNMYIAANAMVYYCVRKYWNTPEESILFLSQFRQVQAITEQLDTIQKEKVVASINRDTAAIQALENKFQVLWKEKINLRNHVMKPALAKECEHDGCIQEIRALKEFRAVPNRILHRLYFEISQNFLYELSDVKKGKRHLRTYERKATNIYFEYGREAPFRKTKSEEILFNWIGRTFTLRFGRDESGNRPLFEEVIAAGCRPSLFGDSHIFIDRKNKIIIQQTFKLERQEVTSQPHSERKLHMGVDLGYNVPLYWALSDFSKDGIIGDGAEIKRIRGQFDRRLHHLQNSLKLKETRFATLKEVRRRKVWKLEREYIRNLNRNLAAELIKKADELLVRVIRLEGLNFSATFKEHNEMRVALNEEQARKGEQKQYQNRHERLLQMFSNWKYGQLISFIKEKAIKFGIEVIFVDQRNTSVICNRCNKKGTRKGKYLYLWKDKKCAETGCPCKRASLDKNTQKFKHPIDADRNAAYNIARWPQEKFVTPKEVKQIAEYIDGKKKEKKEVDRRGKGGNRGKKKG